MLNPFTVKAGYNVDIILTVKEVGRGSGVAVMQFLDGKVCLGFKDLDARSERAQFARVLGWGDAV